MSKPGGITPTIVRVMVSARNVWPRMFGFPANVCCHISQDRIVTRCAPGTESASVNHRPMRGPTPSVGRKPGVRTPTVGRIGGVVSTLNSAARYAPRLLNDWLFFSSSRTSGMDIQNWSKPRLGNVVVTYSSCSAFGYGSGRRSTPLTTLKIAVLAPMPSASVRTVSAANPGWRLRPRRAYRRSFFRLSMKASMNPRRGVVGGGAEKCSAADVPTVSAASRTQANSVPMGPKRARSRARQAMAARSRSGPTTARNSRGSSRASIR